LRNRAGRDVLNQYRTQWTGSLAVHSASFRVLAISYSVGFARLDELIDSNAQLFYNFPVWPEVFGFHQDRTPTHAYEPMRETAMVAFAKSWFCAQRGPTLHRWVTSSRLRRIVEVILVAGVS